MEHLEKVKKYYDLNTRRFLRWGENQGTRNIHAGLWGDGVQTVGEAMDYANELIFQEIEHLPGKASAILDLGCGVGESLFYIGNKLANHERLTGVTLSGEQAQIAEELCSQAGKNYDFKEGNFLDLSFLEGQFDLAFAIEAFIHAPDTAGFFRSVSNKIRKGGRLVLIDDFLTQNGAQPNPIGSTFIEDYRKYWLLGSLDTLSNIETMAAEAKFRLVKTRDLTPLLKLGRPRDRLIRFFSHYFKPFLRPSSYGRMLIGGDARQRCLQECLVDYRLLVFEKTGNANQ